MAAKYMSQNSRFDMDTSKQAKQNTKVVLVDEELSSYPYCRLPAHYFDLLLHKKGAAHLAASATQAPFNRYAELR